MKVRLVRLYQPTQWFSMLVLSDSISPYKKDTSYVSLPIPLDLLNFEFRP